MKQINDRTVFLAVIWILHNSRAAVIYSVNTNLLFEMSIPEIPETY